jgi:hypothetical protein
VKYYHVIPEGQVEYPMAYEPFNYAGGTLLAGRNGGDGFIGPWSDSTGNATIGYSGLGYSSLPVNGMKMTSTHSVDTSARFDRDLGFSVGQDGTTIWVSFLFRARSDSPSGKFFTFGHYGFLMGKKWGNELAIGMDGGTMQKGTGIVVQTNHTYFLVGRIDFNQGTEREDVYMWVDPPLDTEPSTSSADVVHEIYSFTADFVNFRGLGYGTNDVDFDELRVGTSWESVSGAVFGLGETVGMMILDVVNGRNLISNPFEPYPEGGGIPGQSTLDKIVGDQLTGHSVVRSLSDTIEKWDAINQRYLRTWYNTSAGWRDWDVTTNPPAFGFDADAGYWFNRVLDHPDTTLTFCGRVSITDRDIPVEIRRNLVGSCFPLGRSLSESGLVESGFTGHAGVRSLSDTVEFWDNTTSSYERFWQQTGVGWQPWDVGDPVRDIQPGDAIWVNLPLRTVGFTWTYPAP